jgi:hypothetical protein
MIEVKTADDPAASRLPGIHVTCRVNIERTPLARVKGLLSKEQPQPGIDF